MLGHCRPLPESARSRCWPDCWPNNRQLTHSNNRRQRLDSIGSNGFGGPFSGPLSDPLKYKFHYFLHFRDIIDKCVSKVWKFLSVVKQIKVSFISIRFSHYWPSIKRLIISRQSNAWLDLAKPIGYANICALMSWALILSFIDDHL